MGKISDAARVDAGPPPGGRRYDRREILSDLTEAITRLRFGATDKGRLARGCKDLVDALDRCGGQTLQDRWTSFEKTIWPKWRAGEDRNPTHRWMWGTRVIVMARFVRPSWEWIAWVHMPRWVARLPSGDPLLDQHDRLAKAVGLITWAGPIVQLRAVSNGLRMLLVRGYASLSELTEEDLKAIPPQSTGTDVLDAALCSLGVFNRTPQRGPTRRHRRSRHTIAHLVAMADIAEPFRAVTELYVEVYSTRISDLYNTQRQKVSALGHFWRFIAHRYPEITSCAEVLPVHGRAFITHAIERARELGRGGEHNEATARITAHAWLLNVRVFFADICTWATEPDSPFTPFAPRAVPLARHDLKGVDFEKARQQLLKRMTATVYDLEREVPKIRAFAFRRWHEAETALKAAPDDVRCRSVEAHTFWDWAILELLVQSGLRIEEASELTTLDVLKRRTPDAQVYYMLHVKPSKYDRARVIPIGDGLGRVVAEMIRHVRSFHGSDTVPFCDHWDHHEKRPLPRAPYLVQALKHPSAMGMQGMRHRLQKLAAKAGAAKADGTPLRLHPHDCRRVFASEHLNNNTPVHVIQALLGHATINTVLVYAKLYPQTMVDEYRKAVRGLYIAFHGEESLRNPTAEEWAAFSTSCSMRDMGTHLCALPTGEYCPKGLVCLGCVHAQPKKSAAPIFRRMLASHERELAAAKGRQEPAGQVAARELEVARIRGALMRAEELSGDVAAAIEASCLASG